MLKLVKEKGPIEDSEVLTTKYSNGIYNVYFNESGDDLKINVTKENFKKPSIEVRKKYEDANVFELNINIAATGSLNLGEIESHMADLELAKLTLEEIKDLIDKYEFTI